MNHADPFEERLRRQPLRALPPAWREDILTAAAANAPVAAGPGLPLLVAFWGRLREIFWPAPQAWAALAAVWLVLLAVNFAARNPAPMSLVQRTPPTTPLMRELIQEQRQLLAELVGPSEARAAERPKPLVPQPHSQRHEARLNA